MTYKKLAIFVEGKTESIFVSRLLQELAGEKSIRFEHVSYPSICLLKDKDQEKDIKYFVLVYDCQNDETVKSRIIDQRENLIKSNYEMIIGLRDLYPNARADLPKVETNLYTRVPTKEIKTVMCLSVMEIEAWFLQEANHFGLIDVSLTLEKIRASNFFDPSIGNAENDIDHPSEMLNNIYQLAQKSYKKRKNNIVRTVNALDYSNLYFNLRDKLTYLDKFLGQIDEFLA